MEEKRILIINVNWVGDVLFSTPFIRAMREAYPKGYIACLVHPRCKDVLDGNPRIDEIIIYDEEGLHKSIFGKIKLILYLRKKRFDSAFILHRSFTKALIAMLAAIPERIGYPTKNRSWLLTKALDEPDAETHKVEYFLNMARSVGIRPPSLSYEFFISDPDRRWAKGFLGSNDARDGELLVAICPGGNWDPKRWPRKNFAALCDNLADKLKARILITGAKRDLSLAQEIKNEMKNKPLMACGRTTLKQLAALLEISDLVIANDTGSMHMAIAMKAKTIALFGPTSPRITGPYGNGIYTVIMKNDTCEVPCYDVTCRDNRCMSAITVGDVLSEAERMLTQSPKYENR